MRFYHSRSKKQDLIRLDEVLLLVILLGLANRNRVALCFYMGAKLFPAFLNNGNGFVF